MKSRSKSNSKSNSKKTKTVKINSTELQQKKKILDKRRSATKKIRNSLKNVKTRLAPKIRARFLNAICSDSGVCMAFGKEREIIHAHFGHFKNFKYVPSLAKRIGKASANGYVINVPFERDG